jgi:CelD/BcsL family acetyltransferase involved in cellulose biosynthesis
VTAAVELRFQIGARTLFSLSRRLQRVPLSLADVLAGTAPALPPLDRGAEGYSVTSVPLGRVESLAAQHPELRAFVRQEYERSYVDLAQPFDDYWSAFSGKTRSTLKRKRRKLEEASGGALDVRFFHAPGDVDAFYRDARTVSAKTYQERLMGSGFPEGEEAAARLRQLAASDALRGWILYLEGAPVSYLYAPGEGDVLIYSHLGYDPDHAALSPGTVLQVEALTQIMGRDRFTLFDFTEGDGQHKRLFASASVPCADLLLLRPTLANRASIASLRMFDGAVGAAKAGLKRLGRDGAFRGLRRGQAA